MSIFISHNKKQKSAARILALALEELGEQVWFDEWTLRPGDSLICGIEEGLTNTSIFVLIWSADAAQSNWVDTEVRAYLRRRVDDSSLRIIPVMLDDTPLPTLVAEYYGLKARGPKSLRKVAATICGSPHEGAVIQRLQKRIQALTIDPNSGRDPLPYIRCPDCGNSDLDRSSSTDPVRDDVYYVIGCTKCGWGEATQ